MFHFGQKKRYLGRIAIWRGFERENKFVSITLFGCFWYWPSLKAQILVYSIGNKMKHILKFCETKSKGWKVSSADLWVMITIPCFQSIKFKQVSYNLLLHQHFFPPIFSLQCSWYSLKLLCLIFFAFKNKKGATHLRKKSFYQVTQFSHQRHNSFLNCAVISCAFWQNIHVSTNLYASLSFFICHAVPWRRSFMHMNITYCWIE